MTSKLKALVVNHRVRAFPNGIRSKRAGRGIFRDAASYGKDVSLPRRRTTSNHQSRLPMKTLPQLTRTILVASILFAGPLAVAQAPAPRAPSPIAQPSHSATQQPTQTLHVLEIPAGPLKTVVAALQDNLDAQNLERMNILIAPGTKTSAILPEMILRDVTGPEALSLIATAAACSVEPIHGPDTAEGQPPRIVGYKLESEPATGRGSGRGPGLPRQVDRDFGLPPGRMVRESLDIQGGPPRVIAGMTSGGAGMGDIAIFGGAGTSGAGDGLSGFGRDAEGIGGGGADPAVSGGGVETRVYPLATISASSSFEEIKKTLDDVLTTSGVKNDQVKLGFHDKTNVLVLRGPAEAQAVVTQLITAL